MDEATEKSAMRKIYIRLLPFAILSYFLAYVDRINVSFAALTMRDDLKMSATAYGFALGTFYWAYFIFEVPSNIAMEKVGARLWIARIMITWGLLACATAYVTGATSFGVVRFLLGAAEAGFFPGIILYFTYWFPSYHHARIVSGFLIGLPIAVAAGAPLSTALLGLDGLLGLRGWQIMYLAEGIPTLLIGIVTLFVLTDRPEQAKFLTQEEKDWLRARLDAERTAKESVRTFTLWQSMIDRKVLLLSLNYLGIVTASLGMLFFIPQIIKSIGVTSNMTVGWLTMVPYICGGIGLVIWGFVSDRMNERRWNSAGRLHRLHGWVGYGRHDDGHVVVTGRNVGRSRRVLWLQRAVLGDAADVPHRHCRRRRDRLDQFDRQSRRLLRPLVCRRNEGCDRQFLRRSLRTGVARSYLRLRLCFLPAHPYGRSIACRTSTRRRVAGGLMRPCVPVLILCR